MEELWPEQDYADPRGATRALIFRLRKLLAHSGEDYIKYSQGHYQWNLESQYWLDIDEFESLAQQAQDCWEIDPNRAEDLLTQALNLYKGEFLPECYYSQWTIPVRNYYQSLCLQVVLDLIDLLKQRDDQGKIVQVCEKVIMSHPYEEELHMHYLQGLLRENRIQHAQKHYEYISRKFYQDLGVKPSPVLQKMMQSAGGREQTGLDLNGIQNKLEQNPNQDGAFLCDADVFKEIYKLEKRRGERSGIAIFLALISLRGKDGGTMEDKLLKSSMDRLEKYLVSNLRKGDVIARWSENQYVLLLPGMAYEQGEMVMERFKKGFSDRNPMITITSQIQPVLPLALYT